MFSQETADLPHKGSHNHEEAAPLYKSMPSVIKRAAESTGRSSKVYKKMCEDASGLNASPRDRKVVTNARSAAVKRIKAAMWDFGDSTETDAAGASSVENVSEALPVCGTQADASGTEEGDSEMEVMDDDYDSAEERARSRQPAIDAFKRQYAAKRRAENFCR